MVTAVVCILFYLSFICLFTIDNPISQTFTRGSRCVTGIVYEI